MVKAAEAMSARARARQAKAALDAERAKQDRLIVEATTAFYEAAEAWEAAQEAVVTAELSRAAAVAGLSELGQTEAQIATLCGLTTKEVRELRRRASAARKEIEQADAQEAAEAPVEHSEAPAADATAA